MSRRQFHNSRHQHGAALVVGMILLVVLTLLAISGMNTASLNLQMAGNAQYYQNAFQASEDGIAQAIRYAAFNPNVSSEPVAPQNGVTFTANVNRQMDGEPLPAIWGSSWDSFSTYHFEIQIAGQSARNAQSTLIQGMAIIAPWDSTTRPLSSLPTTLTP